MRDHSPNALKLARHLRREMTPPERMLWSKLRGSPEGLRFRRQHPVGDYVADFFCHSAKTVIEIDGIAHDMGQRPTRDLQRDERLAQLGFRVIRIPATELLADCEAIAEAIFRTCRNIPPPTALCAATSPGG